MTTQKHSLNAKGYTTPRAFSGFQVPVSVQSLVLRRYCENRGLIFNHHVSENITPNSYLVLERLVVEAHLYDIISMCSIGMLPNNRNKRTQLIRRVLLEGVSLHFVFEQVILTSCDDIEKLNVLTSLCNLIPDHESQVKYLRSVIK